MDRDEKIARLEAWLEDEDHSPDGQRLCMLRIKEGTEWEEEVRKWDAVVHELQRQVDKKIIEDLGLFEE